MSRTDTPEERRRDFHLFIDEFHNFTTDSFAAILSEARKYRLCLTLSHQYIDQLRPEIREAVFGNVGSLITFRVGHRDAKVLEGEFGDSYIPARYAGLGNHEICAKLLTHGQECEPFFGKTLPPRANPSGRREIIIRRSREKYSCKRNVVEEKIQRWLRSN